MDPKRAFAWMESLLIDPIDGAMNGVISSLSSNLKTPATIMAIILIIFYGFKLIYGRVDAAGFVTMICRIAVVTLLVTNAANFNFYVKDVFFKHLPDEISKAMSSKGKVEASVFDQIIKDTSKKVTTLRKNLGWKDIAGKLTCYLIVIVVIIFCCIGFLVQSFAKLGLAIVISLGPVFICLYMWDSTKRFTEAWIAQAANFVILQLLVVSLLSILAGLYKEVMGAEWNHVAAMLVPILAVTFVSKAMLISLPFIASALAGGGASLTGSGLAKDAGSVAKGAASAGKAAGRAGVAAGRAGVAAGRAAKQGIKKFFG